MSKPNQPNTPPEESNLSSVDPADREHNEDNNKSPSVPNPWQSPPSTHSDKPIAYDETIDSKASNDTNNSCADDVSKNTDWVALAGKLRQHNRELAKTIVKLEQDLAKSQEQLQSQVTRSRSTEVLIAQQGEEINLTQKQLTDLFLELETSHQATQSKDILVEDLSQKLESSQKRIAQLERECASLQDKYNQQCQKLSESEKTVSELRYRLHRQQRHTLQFKAALEQCLEEPAHLNRALHSPAFTMEQLSKTTSINSVVPKKVEAIEPWSTQIDEIDSKSNSRTLNEKLIGNGATAPSGEELEPQLEIKQIDSKWSLDAAKPNNESVKAEIEQPAPQVIEKLDKNSHPPSKKPIISSASNWPSPLIHPLRSSKKRKSKKKIDLPKFPRYGNS